MAEVKFNEMGDLVNAETGEVIGHNDGERVVIDVADGELISPEQLGVREPTPTAADYANARYSWEAPSEEELALREEEERAKANHSAGKKNVESKNNVNVNNDIPQSQQYSHIDAGPTSFVVNRTKYEVTPDSYFVVKFGLVQKDDGHFVVVEPEVVPETSGAEPHWVKFRMWNYDEELKWRSECTEFNNNMKVQYINVEKFNELKVRRLMMDWSFGECEDRLKLLHCDGVLSDESYSIFKGMYPSIANRIVALMNGVLENNQ